MWRVLCPASGSAFCNQYAARLIRYAVVYTIDDRSINGFYMLFDYEMELLHGYLFKGTFEPAQEQQTQRPWCVGSRGVLGVMLLVAR
jgi:hypothetical protein